MKQISPLSWPILGKLSQHDFLAKYWQKKPLLMKRALHPFPDIITPDEVAGLACDERVESRLILEKGGKSPWELRRGPFKPSLFSKLPKSHWTILVNGVDRFVPAVNGLLDHFSFIPFWRIDDVMISVAYDKGNVGAHVDNFDVFLVQAHGTREWLIEDRPVLTDDFVPNLPIRLLRKFKPTHRWVLEPGDILYLPPRVPHHGIARGDRCMTISVGFRAPKVHEIMNALVTKALAAGDENVRYSDPDLKPQAPGEISREAIAKIQDLIQRELLSSETIQDWLGTFTTEPYCDVELPKRSRRMTVSKLRTRIAQVDSLSRSEGARLAFIRTGKNSIDFFVNGEKMSLSGRSASLAERLANQVVVPSKDIKAFVSDTRAATLLCSLMEKGIIVES